MGLAATNQSRHQRAYLHLRTRCGGANISQTLFLVSYQSLKLLEKEVAITASCCVGGRSVAGNYDSSAPILVATVNPMCSPALNSYNSESYSDQAIGLEWIPS